MQVSVEVFLEMQSELSEERRKPSRHAPVPGGRLDDDEPGPDLDPVRVREHVRAQQLKTRKKN